MHTQSANNPTLLVCESGANYFWRMNCSVTSARRTPSLVMMVRCCGVWGPADLTDEAILQRLVDLNRERAAEEGRGIVRYEFRGLLGARSILLSSQPSRANRGWRGRSPLR